MKRGRFILIALTLVFILGAAWDLGLEKHKRNIGNELEQNQKLMMDYIEKSIRDNPRMGLSSSPYTFIENNPYYDRIIAMGMEAIPAIESKIKSTNGTGFNEYLLAAAAEKISKANLRPKGYGWGTASEWLEVWDKFLKDLPSTVSEIAAQDISKEEKNKKLLQLGLPAVPFIKDKIREGHSELKPTVDEIMKGTNMVDLQWIRRMVLARQVS